MIVEQVGPLLLIKHTPCDAVHKAGCLFNPTSVVCFPILLWVEIYCHYDVKHLLYTFLTSLAFINPFNIASCKSLERNVFLLFLLYLNFQNFYLFCLPKQK